jgi:hypothetical protein
VTILFIARHFTYFRNFDSVVEALAQRGHRLHLAADRDDEQGGRALVDHLAARYPSVSVRTTPIRYWGRYRRVSQALRLGLDYLRYSDARFAAMPKIRQRAYDRTPAFILALARLPGRGFLARALAWLEAAVPRQAGVDDFIRDAAADLLIVTPLIELGSPQLDYLRAARAQGIRTALAVWSWDHLSSKALIRVAPDVLLVWNETQRGEAERFHGIGPDRVIVTGAQCFDRWFDRAPSRDRATFCRRAGLPDDGPFVLYVCSALFRGSRPEAAFVRAWAAAIRASTAPEVAGIRVLIRPHPQRLDEWADGAGVEGATVWGSSPTDEEGRADYFDSLFHCGAVVGLNTSALVEAAIVDRPVFTILLPEYYENQEGTYHFHHLMTVGEGCLTVSRSLDQHVAQLAAWARGEPTRSNRPFVERFIRPRGLATSATAVFVDAVETLAARPAPPRQRTPLWVYLLRPVVYALVLAGRIPFLERIYWNPAKFRQLASV